MIDKITKTISEYTQINSEIQEIEAMALLIANDHIKISFSMEVNKYDYVAPETTLEEDFRSAFVKSVLTQSMLGFNPFKAKEEKPLKEISFNLSLNHGLNLLNFLLKEKQEKRQNLLHRLESFGVKI